MEVRERILAPAKIRQEALAEGHWLIFNTMSVLGECLAGGTASSSDAPTEPSLALRARIEKLREVEPLLLEGYEGMKDQPEAPDERKREALERIVKLYETWHAAEPDAGHDAQAAEWRGKLEEEGTKAARHEGTKGKESTTQPAASAPATKDEE